MSDRPSDPFAQAPGVALAPTSGAALPRSNPFAAQAPTSTSELFAAAGSDPQTAGAATAPITTSGGLFTAAAAGSDQGGGLFASGPPKSSAEGGGLFAPAASAEPNPFVHHSSEGGLPSAGGTVGAPQAAPPPSAASGAATPGRPPAAFMPSAGGPFSRPLSTKPTAGGSCHVAFEDVCVGESYACAVAPIIAECTEGPAVNDAITLHVHGHGEVTLPKWFVEDFVTMVKPLDEAHLSHHAHDGSINIFVPTERLDDPPPAYVGPRAKGCPIGWTNAGCFDFKSQIAPPTLVGSARALFSATPVLCPTPSCHSS